MYDLKSPQKNINARIARRFLTQYLDIEKMAILYIHKILAQLEKENVFLINFAVSLMCCNRVLLCKTAAVAD